MEIQASDGSDSGNRGVIGLNVYGEKSREEVGRGERVVGAQDLLPWG